ncbi:hypothetical protein L9F63_004616, partial [Diploptera punctata]
GFWSNFDRSGTTTHYYVAWFLESAVSYVLLVVVTSLFLEDRELQFRSYNKKHLTVNDIKISFLLCTYEGMQEFVQWSDFSFVQYNTCVLSFSHLIVIRALCMLFSFLYGICSVSNSCMVKQMVMHAKLKTCTAHNIRTDVNHILERFKTFTADSGVRFLAFMASCRPATYDLNKLSVSSYAVFGVGPFIHISSCVIQNTFLLVYGETSHALVPESNIVVKKVDGIIIILNKK